MKAVEGQSEGAGSISSEGKRSTKATTLEKPFSTKKTRKEGEVQGEASLKGPGPPSGVESDQ